MLILISEGARGGAAAVAQSGSTAGPGESNGRLTRGSDWTGWWPSPIAVGAPNRFHGIMLPKTRGPEEIKEVAKLLDDLEKRAGWKYRLQIESLIETLQSLVKAYEIATASDRMAGLVFGIADFAANLGVREIVERQNENFHYAKQAVVVAAKAAGLHAIDNVYLRLWRKEDSPERVAELQRDFARKIRARRASGWTGRG